MLTTRETLRSLVEQLPESEIMTARRVLEALTALGNDPFLQALSEAPEDDELLTPEEEALIEEGQLELRQGNGRLLEEARRELLDE